MKHVKRAVEQAEKETQEKGLPHNSLAVLKTPVGSPKDVISYTQIPRDMILYTEPHMVKVLPDMLRDNRVILGRENDAIASAYKMLRTQVMQRMRENGWKALGITSCRPGEGKSLTAVNLAISLANAIDHTVLLVDADLRRPRLHEYFGYTSERGLSDYLLDGVPLRETVFSPGIERLVVLPAGNAIINSSEMLSSSKMVQLIEGLKTVYPAQLVVFDLPPLLSTDDALAFSPHIDAVLLVLEKGKTSKEEVKQAMKLLQGVNVLGTVLNKSDEKNKGYY